ncbi:MAG: ChaB family protein [Dehalococcoidia bacterium]|nr:ChaB family protein [Dehalococcoidia bacterium]
MPYSIENPPDKIKDMPKHAQEIFISAFNAAIKQYEGDEGKAHATAYAAVNTKYKQDDKGNWIAKESEVSMDLQAKYAEIIQEAGKKGKVNDPKVQKLVALIKPTEGGLNDIGLVAEVDTILAWLKEQATMKTEDGVQYPASAFAYVSDPDKPSEWKLRLWEDPEKKVTKTQLGRAAAALSPGGFRGQRVEIPREDLSSVKRKIRAAYRSLDVADEDIPRWVKESEVRTILSDVMNLGEATITSKGIATIVVIKPGLNSSKERYYPPEVLNRDFSLFEGVKMYADHPTPEDEKARPERSIKDWVATLKNVHIDESGRLVGEAIVVEPWMQQKLANLRDKGMLQEMGISINAVGTATKGEIEGVKTNIIERIVRVRSVDFVTEPGAGGMVTMFETDKENDIDLIGLETLKERRPDLVKSIESEVKAKTLQEVKHMEEQEVKIKELETQNETLAKENTELKTKMTEAEKAQKKAEAKSKIDEAISKSELPEAAKIRLTEKSKDSETADGIIEAIKAEEDYVKSIKESGKVVNMGGTKPDPEADKKALRESFRQANPKWTDAQLDAAVNRR